MQEKGIIQQLYNRWWKGSGGCQRDQKQDSKASRLGMENVGGIFVVLLGGLALAIIVALCEFSYHAKRKSQNCRVRLFLNT